ncbi:hypothetical protein [Halobaculum sp. P14]|uniref:hypothetical protein n=1 Tax=Halobaculum sp. P14 TaxID=3421638 RepID=UPI003EC0733F
METSPADDVPLTGSELSALADALESGDDTEVDLSDVTGGEIEAVARAVALRSALTETAAREALAAELTDRTRDAPTLDAEAPTDDPASALDAPPVDDRTAESPLSDGPVDESPPGPTEPLHRAVRPESAPAAQSEAAASGSHGRPASAGGDEAAGGRPRGASAPRRHRRGGGETDTSPGVAGVDHESEAVFKATLREDGSVSVPEPERSVLGLDAGETVQVQVHRVADADVGDGGRGGDGGDGGIDGNGGGRDGPAE